MVPRVAFTAFILSFALLVACIGFVIYNQRQHDQERSERNRVVNLAFLTNCRNREHEIGELRQRLHMPPTGVKCMSLPVFGK